MSKEVIWNELYEERMVKFGRLDDKMAKILKLHIDGESIRYIAFKTGYCESSIEKKIGRLKQVYDSVRQYHPDMPPREKLCEKRRRLREEKERNNSIAI